MELMFEGQRFFDLRRWKRMEEAYSPENCPTAMKIYKLGDGSLLYSHETTIYSSGISKKKCIGCLFLVMS